MALICKKINQYFFTYFLFWGNEILREKILNLLDEKNFISGEKISKRIGISRTAVWKHIAYLKKIGYNIESKKNLGYRLISRPDNPVEEELVNKLNTKIIGKKIVYLKTVDSTNNYAKKLIKNEYLEGTVIISEIQTKGRGRKNREWISPEGGLWFSVILNPNIPTMKGMLITMLCSVSIVESIKKITGLNPVIKWPNDILINNKKVCGILTELDAEIDRINYMIVGIGINVNNIINKKLLNMATSLSNEKKVDISRVNLFINILDNLDKNYLIFKSNQIKYIREQWIKYSNIIGRKIRIINNKKEITGKVLSVDESGCLILNYNGKNIKIITGDIKYL